jgi:hypothetical protein
LASNGPGNPLDLPPSVLKPFRFGLRTALLVTTILAVVAGLYFSRQQRRAAAFRRFETTWSQLETLVQAPVEGFVAAGQLARNIPSFGAEGTAATIQWRFTLKTTPDTFKLDPVALVRKIRVHFGTPLIKLGLEECSSLETSRLWSDEWIFQDDAGESSVILRVDLDDAQTKADVSLLWLHRARAGAW